MNTQLIGPNFIEERSQKAKELFLEGYNCCQSVLLAYHDIWDIDPLFAATIAAPLGGGMGRLREVCGACSGMFLVGGFICPANNPTDKVAKAQNYTLVQELAEDFRKQNGSIICRELLGLEHKQDTPTPSDRTESYYKKRPCAELVAIAASIVGKKIVEQMQH